MNTDEKRFFALHCDSLLSARRQPARTARQRLRSKIRAAVLRHYKKKHKITASMPSIEDIRAINLEGDRIIASMKLGRFKKR